MIGITVYHPSAEITLWKFLFIKDSKMISVIMRMTRAVFSRPVSIMYARRRRWGRLSPLLSIWNGVRALRARWDGKEFAHTVRRGQKSSEREREREREYRAGDRSTKINIEGSLAAGPRG